MKPVAEVHGDLGCVMINGRRVHLLKPTTFMNLSGKSVQAALSLLDITNLERLLVIIDDIYLPVGGLRVQPALLSAIGRLRRAQARPKGWDTGPGSE